MCRDGLNGIHKESIGLAIGWLASVSVHTFNLHERALNNVSVSVESHLHHCVKWNLQWTKDIHDWVATGKLKIIATLKQNIVLTARTFCWC